MNINGGVGLENYFSLEEIFELENNRENGFKYIKPENYMKSNNFQAMIDEINDIFKLEMFNYSKNSYNTEKKFYSDTVIITVSGNSRDTAFNIYCKSEFDLNRIYNICLKHNKDEEESEVKCFFESFYIKQNGIDKTTKVLTMKDVKDISESYYPFMNTKKTFEQFCTGNENILILTGPAGRGKTKFTNLLFKHLFQEPENIPYDKLEAIPELDEQFFNVAYVKSTDILAMDEFWRTLQKELPDFVILDDLDYMLTKRESEVMTSDDAKKNAFLNQLLSYTDGVQKNKTKFIITTNQHFDDVDSALLRKGRLFNILEFRTLKNSEALKIWSEAELSEEEFQKLFQEDVLQSDLGSEIAKRKNKRIKDITDDYLYEPEISKIKRKNKRMTL
jgi:Cdc6-like AAA superfamily ATPase